MACKSSRCIVFFKFLILIIMLPPFVIYGPPADMKPRNHSFVFFMCMPWYRCRNLNLVALKSSTIKTSTKLISSSDKSNLFSCPIYVSRKLFELDVVANYIEMTNYLCTRTVGAEGSLPSELIPVDHPPLAGAPCAYDLTGIFLSEIQIEWLQDHMLKMLLN